MFDLFSFPFNSAKLKSRLKMAAGRLDIDSAKKTALMKQNMRGVAELLAESPPQEAKARLRTEALIRDDNTVMAYDILKLECQLLAERVSIIDHCVEPPPDLVGCISDLIFAAPRLGIKELSSVRKQFRKKYGRAFKLRAMNNEGGILNHKIVENLSLSPPDSRQVNLYMEKICKHHEVDWCPAIQLNEDQVIQSTPVPEIPVVTGLKDQDDKDDDDGAQSNARNLESLEVLPPPTTCYYTGFKKDANHDSASVTSSSSGSSSPSGGGRGGAAPASTGNGPLVIAFPCNDTKYTSPDVMPSFETEKMDKHVTCY